MMKLCVLIACALCGGFVPYRLHPKLAMIVEWATAKPGQA